MCVDRRRHSGVTLIELIVFIVVVSVGLAGVLASLNISVRGSADPLQPKQALAIAEGLLEEILLKGYCDPDTIDTITTFPVPTCGANGAESRANYDAIEDFDAIDLVGTVISKDAANNDWPSGHTPTVTVTAVPSFGPAGATVAALRVVVSVSYGTGQSISLTGYRTNY